MQMSIIFFYRQHRNFLFF